MAKIVDPDSLNQGTEVVFDRGARTIQLLIAGNLDDSSPGATSGVTLQAVYSFCKEEWKDDTNLNKQPFPLFAVTETQMQLQNGWQWADATTRQLLRDGGWTESVGAENGDIYAGFVSLGTFDADTDQARYQQVIGYDQSTSTFDKTGQLNEAVLVFDADGPDLTGYFKATLRVQAKTYGEYNLLVESGLSALQNRLYSFPLTNGTDINVTNGDAFIDANPPYTGMDINFLKGSGFTTWANSTVYPAGAVVLDPIRQSGGSSNGTWWFTPGGGTTSGTGTADDTGITDWESYVGEEQIGSEWYAFNVVVRGNSGTKEQIHEFCQRELRRTADINDNLLGSPNQNAYGTVNGDASKRFTFFEGDLITRPGVLIRNFDANDTNAIQFSDITVDGGGLDAEDNPVTSTRRTFPFVAAGTLNFSDNLVNETNANTFYVMYFTYIETITESTLAITGSSGATATLDNTGGTDLTTLLQTNDWLTLSGFANAENNGRWEVTGAVTATTAALTKRQSPATPTDEVAGPSVTLNTNPFGTDGAIIVDDNSAVDIQGQVTTSPIAFDFDYDNNTQGGRIAGVDAPVSIMAQGLADSQNILVTGTITRATGLTFSVLAQDELNYSNP